MNIKKKLLSGMLCLMMGVSLIGGGTWAAFNDMEAVANTVQAGTLDFGTGSATELFKISDLKPGDEMTRSITLRNDGTLDINQVFLKATNMRDWKDKDVLGLQKKTGISTIGNNTTNEFLQQFQLKITKKANGKQEVIFGGDGKSTLYTLNFLTAPPLQNKPTFFEITKTDDNTVGLAKGETIEYEFYLKFKDDKEKIKVPGKGKDTPFYKQNRFQGEEITFDLIFEATQMKGNTR